MGYQMPSSICMWPMAQRMAGEASGELPTYWTKWSSICAVLASGMNSRMVPATVLPRRMRMTSRRTLMSKAPPTSMVSRMEPMDRQKKKRSEMEWSCSEVCRSLR